MSATGLPQLLRQREVIKLLGVSRPTLWAWRRKGLFPAPLQIGPNVVAWPAHVVAQWIKERASA